MRRASIARQAVATASSDRTTAADIEVVKPLDSELDQQAIKAFAQWEFKPGTHEGKPVAVRITCELRFTLKSLATERRVANRTEAARHHADAVTQRCWEAVVQLRTASEDTENSPRA